ncbi:MAG: putative hydrolase or acyltransferase of alpha/beta superfamily [Deltaproteobacteria bacterium]|nr:putative hydrolase or acyltransferase of alpha/beta superfamily [Deltaproteobacteria bacterium]
MKIEKYGSGVPIVFIHGAGGSTLSWVFQKAYFEGTHTVILVDLPGHGISDSPSLGSISGCADALKNTFEDNAIASAFIVGHSMGGAVAMDFAMRYPALVRGIVLIGTGARLKVYPEILESVLKDKEKTARMIIDTAFSTAFPARLKEKAFTEYMKNDAKTIFNDFTACDGFNVMGRLNSVSVPALVICGTEDRFTPVKYSQYLSDSIPGAELVLIEGAGHMVMIEKPGEVNSAIQVFTLKS